MMDTSNKVNEGALFGQRTESVPLTVRSLDARRPAAIETGHPLAFAGLFVFTLLLYVRPNDLFPEMIGMFPIMKIVAILTLIAYVGGKLGSGERLSIWPLEMSMLAMIVLLGIVFTPISASPAASIEMLSDTFFKVIVIFVLMINLLDTRERLRLILKLVVICGTGIATGSVAKFAQGKFTTMHLGVGVRIEGTVGGIFGNPNDLAMALDMLLPLAIVLALTSNMAGRMFYLACSFVLATGVIVTFSRGGFLGLIAAGGILLWKLGRHNRVATIFSALAACAVLALSMPAGYSDRLFTIVHTENDTTGSAQERQGELRRVIDVASRHTIIGIGLNNYPVYSNHAIRAHNSFLEIAAELGLFGLVAYLILILKPLKRLRRIERETSGAAQPLMRELHFLSVGVNAAIIGYMVCAVFSSAQYQWYLFYPIAYALSLKKLHDDETVADGANADSQPALLARSGSLWERRSVSVKG